jgi:hypothetical protein
MISLDTTRPVTTTTARVPPGATQVLAWVTGFFIPIKAARLDIAGLSLYLPYLAALLVALAATSAVQGVIRARLTAPIVVVTVYAAWGVVRTGDPVAPTVTLAKLMITFVATGAFVVLLRKHERQLYLGLFYGVTISVIYATYQWISGRFFNFGLPYTSIALLKVGLGLSSRYTLTRATGFTEEPSFMATLLVGSGLLLVAYASRTRQFGLLKLSLAFGGIGLFVTTSNNLFATGLIVAASWPFIRRRRIAVILVIYYLIALWVTPSVLNRDVTYYSRFFAYDVFRRSSLIDQVLGHGIGSYPSFFRTFRPHFDNQDVASLASVWGGFIFEGGVTLVALVIIWLARVVQRTQWPEGLALLALLLMLSNFNSPWWPIVSLALAQCFVTKRQSTGQRQTYKEAAQRTIENKWRPV